MTLDNASQGHKPIDYGLAIATATFRQPEVETRFRQATLAQTQRQLRKTLTFGVGFELTFWLTDVAALGFNRTTQMMLLARLMVALTVAVGFYLLAKFPRSLSVPLFAATLAEVAAMATFMFIITNRPGEFHWHGMSMSIMLLVYYIFIPNSFVNACSVSLAGTVAFTLLALNADKLNNSDLVTLTLSLVLANAFGILAAHRQARQSRQEFHGREIERQALATQRQFIAMLSHEFRTPLAIIDTTVQRMGLKLELHLPELTPRVGKIRRAVMRMLNLLDNCLTEERLNTTDLVLHTESVELRDFILRSYGEAGAQSSPRIQLVLPEVPEWARCDRHLIDIALSNLVNNALKYSPESSPVTIRMEPKDRQGKIAIHVEDEGEGVPLADRELIFEKFFRSNGNQSVSGAGLGLHLARVLALHHGGNVTLTSQPQRQGSVFTLTLPGSQPIAA